jgi:hypothetical protein
MRGHRSRPDQRESARRPVPLEAAARPHRPPPPSSPDVPAVLLEQHPPPRSNLGPRTDRPVNAQQPSTHSERRRDPRTRRRQPHSRRQQDESGEPHGDRGHEPVAADPYAAFRKAESHHAKLRTEAGESWKSLPVAGPSSRRARLEPRRPRIATLSYRSFSLRRPGAEREGGGSI